jgi:hypothetical protein
MDEVLEALCEVLDSELERQENVLGICRAQQDALYAQDLEYLEAKAAALNALVREAVTGEKDRHRLFRVLVDHHELPPERHTLTELIALSPEPWKSRLRYFQSRLRTTLAETRRFVRLNYALMRRSLQVVAQCMETLTQCAAHADGYDAKGEAPSHLRREANLLDQKG